MGYSTSQGIISMKTTIKLMGYTTLLSLSSGAFASDALQKLTENTYHFYHGYYGSLVVIGEEDVLITDPANTARAQVLKSELKKVTNKPVKYVVFAQDHFD